MAGASERTKAERWERLMGVRNAQSPSAAQRCTVRGRYSGVLSRRPSVRRRRAPRCRRQYFLLPLGNAVRRARSEVLGPHTRGRMSRGGATRGPED